MPDSPIRPAFSVFTYALRSVQQHPALMEILSGIPLEQVRQLDIVNSENRTTKEMRSILTLFPSVTTLKLSSIDGTTAVAICKTLLPLHSGGINFTQPWCFGNGGSDGGYDSADSGNAFHSDLVHEEHHRSAPVPPTLPALQHIHLFEIEFGTMCDCCMKGRDFYPVFTEVLAQRRGLRSVQIEHCTCVTMDETVETWRKLVKDVIWDNTRGAEFEEDE
ncbi:hypothetical protein PENSPDRAFT_679203 [Peniophora sp. CONT]|nr:hypothetical protein PENSPDRAFT_679203 [Peniophora sp. CONT]